MCEKRQQKVITQEISQQINTKQNIINNHLASESASDIADRIKDFRLQIESRDKEIEKLQALKLQHEEMQAIRLENEQLRALSSISGPLDDYDGGLYIVQTSRFFVSKQKVYKIGRTDDIKRRIGQYEKGSKLLFYSVCVQHIKAELEIKKTFASLFKLRADVGHEYFEGDLDTMIDNMSAICKEHNASSTILNEEYVSET